MVSSGMKVPPEIEELGHAVLAGKSHSAGFTLIII